MSVKDRTKGTNRYEDDVADTNYYYVASKWQMITVGDNI